jgi:general secretion pathway protein M
MTRFKALWITLKTRYRTWPRAVQLVVMGLGFGVVAVGMQTGVVRFLNYRAQVRHEIDAYRDEVEHLRAYVARMESVEHERELLSKRLEGLSSRLVPGDTGALAAAHLQDHVTTIANDTGVNVQSAQVMREERVGAYRQVTVRLTIRATTGAFAGFLEAVEYGSMQLFVPFLQLDRRGAATTRRRQAGKSAKPEAERIVSATVEVRGLAAGTEAAAEERTEAATES